AYALAMQFAVDDAAEPGEQSLFETEYRTRIGGCICRQPSELALQQRERPTRQITHRLVERALVEHRERLGRERRIVGIASQRDVQLRSALPQESRVLERGACELARLLLRPGSGGRIEQCGRRDRLTRERTGRAGRSVLI